jgi:hypothetical protein
MKQQFVVTNRYKLLQEREKIERSLINQHVSYENIRTSNFSVDTTFWQEVCFNPSSNVKIAVWGIVWVTINYWYMSGNNICDKVSIQRAHEIEFTLYKLVKLWYVNETPALTFSTVILILTMNRFYLPKQHRVRGLCYGDAVYFLRQQMNSNMLLRWTSCIKGSTIVAPNCIIPPVTWVHFCNILESRPSTRRFH